MTTDNPDPLKVWNKAVDAYDERLFGIPSPDTRADRTAAHHAAAAIIAQHYAPVIAENERLREALQAIATNDESPCDQEGNPMPIRPQWSREQCSSIARQALGIKP